MVSVSYTSEVNDFSFLRQGLGVKAALKCSKNSSTGSMRRAPLLAASLNIGLQPHVIGQAVPGPRHPRLYPLCKKTFDDVWFATREEIAEWHLENQGDHIPASS